MVQQQLNMNIICDYEIDIWLSIAGSVIKNKPKDNRVIPDPIDERKFQE
jgi:hypothetical protein